MKNLCWYKNAQMLFAFLSVLLFVSCNQASEKTTSSTDTVSNVNGYQLVWSDEFNGNAVDTTNWDFKIGGHGWGNHEQESVCGLCV